VNELGKAATMRASTCIRSTPDGGSRESLPTEASSISPGEHANAYQFLAGGGVLKCQPLTCRCFRTSSFLDVFYLILRANPLATHEAYHFDAHDPCLDVLVLDDVHGCIPDIAKKPPHPACVVLSVVIRMVCM